MVKKNIADRQHLSGKSWWILLLLFLLLAVLISTAVAQDGPITQEGDLEFLIEEGPEYVTAPTSEVWIPVTRDAFVSSTNPNTNYGFDGFVRFGFVPPNGLGAMRPMFYYDLTPYIPSTATIIKAELHIYLASVQPSGDSGYRYAAYHLAQSWNEGTVTWSNMPSWGSEFARSNLSNNVGWQVTNITDLAREWQSNPGGNNGVLLLGDERPDQNFEYAYYSKQAGNGLTPRLYVQYDNTMDTTPPVANVIQPSPAGVWSPPNFLVKWEGYDPNNPDGTAGSGIRWYDVYYSTNGGTNWRIGRAQVTTTETNVVGAAHLQRYDFYARARDNAGNEGPVPSGSGSIQTWTRVDASPPAATVNPLPEFTTSTTFTVSWSDTKELNESGVRAYDVQWRVDGGSWNIFVYDTQATSALFQHGANGKTYEFRARAVDNVNNTQYWPEGPQAGTTVFVEPVAFINQFQPNIYQKLDGPAPGDGFTVSWGAITPPGTSVASFEVRYQKPGNTTWLSWQNGTQQTSAFFELDVNDPDGGYRFEARAIDSAGQAGQFYAELGSTMIVDRVGPFLSPRAYMPIIFENANGS